MLTRKIRNDSENLWVILMRRNGLNEESTATNFTSNEESFGCMNLATGKKVKKYFFPRNCTRRKH